MKPAAIFWTGDMTNHATRLVDVVTCRGVQQVHNLKTVIEGQYWTQECCTNTEFQPVFQ